MTSNRTIVEIHILQTTAPGNLNRDDTGSPKTVVYGGATRARVSSQAWKRPTREMFRNLLDPKDLGIRTKRVVEVLVKHVLDKSPQLEGDVVIDAASQVLSGGAGIKLAAPRAKKDADNEKRLEQSTYLLFLGNRQYDRLSDIVLDAIASGDVKNFVKESKKDIKKIVADDRSVDVALFGRMVADDTDLNVDAAAQVAHAISVQAVDPESDFFTAVDDVKQDSEDEEGDSGAAMLGEVEFNAATFYRYANVDVNRLDDTLGDVHATAKAARSFVEAFSESMPQGKINSFAHGTLPELIVVNVRDSQAVNLVGAFERPVRPDYVENATKALVSRQQELDKVYGISPVKTWVVRVGEDTKAADALTGGPSSMREMLEGVQELISERIAQEQL